MQTASLSVIKKELQTLPEEQLMALCISIAKYKKENKELLNYILFESNDEAGYINNIKAEVEESFAGLNSRNFYFAKKGIRKTLRMVNKYIKDSGKATTLIELLIHFCRQLNILGIDYNSSTALANLYASQLNKVIKAIGTLHEDLQYDYLKELKNLG